MKQPTTGLDPEERIRNLLVDFAEKRTVLFSTHVVEDLAATCNQLAVMKKGHFLQAAGRGRHPAAHLKQDKAGN